MTSNFILEVIYFYPILKMLINNKRRYYSKTKSTFARSKKKIWQQVNIKGI